MFFIIYIYVINIEYSRVLSTMKITTDFDFNLFAIEIDDYVKRKIA